MNSPLRIGIIGLGGFAGVHHQALKAMEDRGQCRVICTCDPNPGAFAGQAETLEFSRRELRVYRDYLEMLDAHEAELDVVTIPTPIALHAPMHAECRRRGLAVYLEKPPTLDFRELEEMIAVDFATEQRTQVGFNFIVEEPRQALKKRLSAGEFGKLRTVSIYGLWPRAESYYLRNNWAGRLMVGDNIVLDSCMGNALSHQVQNSLFWCGPDLWDFDEPSRVEAELYRAHDIEGADTVFVRAQMSGGAQLRIALTHACIGDHVHAEQVVCDNAVIDYSCGGGWSVQWLDGRPEERGKADERQLIQENFQVYFDYLRGERPRPLNALAECRPIVHLNDLSYVAARRIHSVEPSLVVRNEGGYREIEGVRQACLLFREDGEMPSEQGLPWAKALGRPAGPADLVRFPETISRMVEGVALTG